MGRKSLFGLNGSVHRSGPSQAEMPFWDVFFKVLGFSIYLKFSVISNVFSIYALEYLMQIAQS